MKPHVYIIAETCCLEKHTPFQNIIFIKTDTDSWFVQGNAFHRKLIEELTAFLPENMTKEDDDGD